jgi:hypothetical protein
MEAADATPPEYPLQGSTVRLAPLPEPSSALAEVPSFVLQGIIWDLN